MYTDFSGNRGASDAPEKFSLFDEEKPRLMSVNFFEHRPSLAPPSFLQPGEKLVNGDLYLFTCIRPVCPPDPPPLHLSLTLPSSGSCRGVQLNWGRRRWTPRWVMCHCRILPFWNSKTAIRQLVAEGYFGSSSATQLVLPRSHWPTTYNVLCKDRFQNLPRCPVVCSKAVPCDLLPSQTRPASLPGTLFIFKIFIDFFIGSLILFLFLNFIDFFIGSLILFLF